jgi:thioredoxin-like negative regulator of GroEL
MTVCVFDRLRVAELIAFGLANCLWGSVGGAVEFQPSIEAARETEAAASPEQRKPLVLAFGAEWCGWCRKMELDTFPSPEVSALADHFLWVKVDVDEDEALSARFRVRGLPHTFVLNGDDRVIASHPGYLPTDEFVEFLNEALTNPQPIEDILGDLLAALDAAEAHDERAAAVKKLIEHLARAEHAERTVALAELAAAQGELLSPIAQLLADERLAVRAAAYGVLSTLSHKELPFDPFAAADERQPQVAAWVQWTASQAAPVEQP